MDKKEKLAAAEKQIDELLKDFREVCVNNLAKALNSGAVPENFMGDDFLLAKIVVDCSMQDRPYRCLKKEYAKEAKNIYKFL